MCACVCVCLHVLCLSNRETCHDVCSRFTVDGSKVVVSVKQHKSSGETWRKQCSEQEVSLRDCTFGTKTLVEDVLSLPIAGVSHKYILKKYANTCQSGLTGISFKTNIIQNATSFFSGKPNILSTVNAFTSISHHLPDITLSYHGKGNPECAL